MKRLNLLLLFFLLATLANAKIYKWVDENGSTHFSDKPYSPKAREVQIKGTGITVSGDGEPGEPEPEVKKPDKPARKENSVAKEKFAEKEISEADYRISSSVGKLGADIMSISGRISAGPICKDMTVTASAKNENGLSASITVQTSKTNSFGSTIFEGNDKVAGSAEDTGFWNVESVTVQCNDEHEQK